MTRYTKQSDSDHSKKKKSDSDERDRRLCVQFESWWVIKIARYFSRTFGFLVVFGCLSSIWRFITLLSVFYFFLIQDLILIVATSAACTVRYHLLKLCGRQSVITCTSTFL